jgi:prepilin-type N-terminal cleavage/methylation domain-containing protein
VDVISHDNEGVQIIAPEAGVTNFNGLANDFRDARLPQIDRPGCGSIQQSVHGNKGLPAGYSLWRKHPVCGETSVEAESHEQRLANNIEVRQAAFVAIHVEDSASRKVGLSFGTVPSRRAEARRRARRPGPPGVTLMEMLVVVMIIALLAGISVPAVSAGIDSVRLRSATDSISAFLNAAEVRAERRQEPIELIVSPKENAFELYSNEPGFNRELKLPDGISIEQVLPPESDDQGPRRLILLPGGAIPSIGVQVANRHGSRRVVHLDPMTGYPRVEAVVTQ